MPPLDLLQWVSIVSNILVAFSAAIVAVCALAGLRQWRHELKGKSQIEAARKVLLLAQQFRHRFKSGRANLLFMQISPRPDNLRSETETKTESEILDSRYTIIQHLQPAFEALQELREASWEAEIILGVNIDAFIRPFTTIFNDVMLAIEETYEEKLTLARDKYAKPWIEAEERKKYRSLLCDPKSQILESIDDALDELRRQLRKYVQ